MHKPTRGAKSVFKYICNSISDNMEENKFVSPEWNVPPLSPFPQKSDITVDVSLANEVVALVVERQIYKLPVK